MGRISMHIHIAFHLSLVFLYIKSELIILLHSLQWKNKPHTPSKTLTWLLKLKKSFQLSYFNSSAHKYSFYTVNCPSTDTLIKIIIITKKHTSAVLKSDFYT